MKKTPSLSTTRIVSCYREMLSLRRLLFADTTFFNMAQAWLEMYDDNPHWRIKLYSSGDKKDYKRKAGVAMFGERLILTADKILFQNAMKGCGLANFVLAHEFGHVALGHHKMSAVVKNFQLSSRPVGMSNIPPNDEELEANYAAVFFQCGVALENPAWAPVDLAKRASSDTLYVKKLAAMVRLWVFQKELFRQNNRFPRVTL